MKIDRLVVQEEHYGCDYNTHILTSDLIIHRSVFTNLSLILRIYTEESVRGLDTLSPSKKVESTFTTDYGSALRVD